MTDRTLPLFGQCADHEDFFVSLRLISFRHGAILSFDSLESERLDQTT